ncbi:hypothetical protein BWQ96_04915 [Gracilariopsis chorda]|uniref:Uncharacterized protein n=1 Tax=Gracilariopsis chorda TaxID=448386 RepID=A0A2V3IT78_9FLOR|nr:hypothetical protein BWQ96_04915 [Gracilariopsis chorda]|eukprot:PXF45325.1 hypothetical protein BWQ96_04915 [Gracilariopsis chorda]
MRPGTTDSGGAAGEERLTIVNLLRIVFPYRYNTEVSDGNNQTRFPFVLGVKDTGGVAGPIYMVRIGILNGGGG